jgi:hypothetical protein
MGRVLALIGGLALVAAFFMPWFGVQVQGQGVTLSGQFLARFLGSTNDLRRFMPGATGGPQEVQMLRGLVFLFPSVGALAVLLVLATAARWRSTASTILLVLVGLIPLIAVVGGLSQLPPGSSIEAGLWTIAIGGVAVVLGALVDEGLRRREASPS